jgi:hypothetical protein
LEHGNSLPPLAAFHFDICGILHVEPLNHLYPFYHYVSLQQYLSPVFFNILIRKHRSLGFDRTRANALAAVGAFIALAVVFLFAFISDRSNQRGASVIAAQTCYLITLIVAHQLEPHVGKWSRWGLWTAVNSFAVGYHPIHNSWVQLNCTDPRERSISIA